MAGLSCAVDWRGWLPVRIGQDAGHLAVDWCRFDARPLREPFFHDSVEAILQLPFNQAFGRRTGLEPLLAWHARSPGLAPTAFVLHASRCGSTLLAQMLARLASHIVLSEPPALDTLLRAHYPEPAVAADQPAALRALLSACGQRRAGGERALVVKLDAWNIAELPLLRQCFPRTPWLFLYRDPLEIVVSQLRMPGRHVVPGMLGHSPIALPAEQATGLSRAEYVARIVGRLLDAGLAHCHALGGWAVNYDELPMALGGRLAHLFALTADDAATALAGARDHAKRPGERFRPDRQDKQHAADEATRMHVQRWAQPAYAGLEALRHRQLGPAAQPA